MYERSIALMERFVSGDAISVRDAKTIESAIDDLAEDGSSLEDLAHDLAMYQPGGGGHLYDYSTMRPKGAYELERLRQLEAENRK